MSRRRVIRRWVVGAVGLAVAAAWVTFATQSQARTGKAEVMPQQLAGAHTHKSRTSDVVAGSYIVGLKNTKASAASVRSAATTLAGRFQGTVTHTYTSTLHGFAAQMTAAQAASLKSDPSVAFVEPNRIVHTSDTTQPAPLNWGLDRIDQTSQPLDHSYTYASTGSNVHVYVIDTGVRPTMTDFGGRVVGGMDIINNTTTVGDCNGHGTHVAGIIGGTAYGVAKAVTIVPVRVLGRTNGTADCSGNGTEADVIAGIEWVTANAVKPAVANLSLEASSSTGIDAAVQASIAAGITYAVAAGNDEDNSCFYSPAEVPEAITVGAVASNDVRPYFSNYGKCVDVNAPGVEITSDYPFTDTTNTTASDASTATLSGTSMASPHVAGVAALIAGENPTYTPQQVRDTLVNASTPDQVDNPGLGSPTSLLYAGSRAAATVRVIRLRAHANTDFVTADPNGVAGMVANRAVPGAWEEFDAIPDGTGDYFLRSHATNKFVTADPNGKNPLVANRTVAGAWERFNVSANADGSLSLQAAVNSDYVTADNGGKSALVNNRTAIGAWEEFDDVTPPSGVIIGSLADDLWVTADPNGKSGLIANRTAVGAWEEFTAVDEGNGRFSLYANANAKFVTADPNGKNPLVNNRTVAGPWEFFTWTENPDGSGYFTAVANNKIVTAENGGASPLVNNRTSAGAWETFVLVS